MATSCLTATRPDVSFLIPVRDGAATLGEAIASALAQTVAPLEVVVVDDGSADGSADVARAFGDPVRVLSIPPTGIAGALNAGLEVCRGSVIARLDSDDVAAPERLALQLPMLVGDVAVVDGQVRFFRDDGPVPAGMSAYADWLNAVITPDDFDRELLVDSPVAHPAATFRADVVRAVGGYRHGPFPEDYDLWLRLHAVGWRLRKVPRVLVAMRDRPARSTRTDPRYGRDGFRRVRQGWLRATALRERRRIVLIGGGKASRPWLRWLREEGHDVVAIVDVARHGRERQGIPVVPPSALAAIDADLGLATIGSRDARAAVRALVGQARPGWREGRDWWLTS